MRPYIHDYEKVDGITCIIKMDKELQKTMVLHPDTMEARERIGVDRKQEAVPLS